MQQQRQRRSAGSKAIAIDGRLALARYRLYLLLSMILSAACGLGLHFILGR